MEVGVGIHGEPGRRRVPVAPAKEIAAMQYALAVERGNPALSNLFNPLDPGVLRLIGELCRQSGDVPVSVCGEVAADPAATATLLGLGIQSLSVAAPAVATIKQAVRRVSLRSPAGG
jgi:phosphocarrier protein FPr